jgi:hypothetical protein
MVKVYRRTVMVVLVLRVLASLSAPIGPILS